MRLKGRVAVITGSTRGIGRAIARRFALEGADLVLNGRDGETVTSLCAELTNAGCRVMAGTADVTDPDAVSAMVESAVTAFGKIDILVNNVGGTQPAPFRFVEEYDRSAWEQILRLNLTSQFLCCRAVVPHMKREGYGRIVNMSSSAGVAGVPLLWSPAYAAAKAAVIGFTKQIALELGQHGIAVNAVAPVDTETERTAELGASRSAYPETHAEMVERYKRHPIPRLARADEIASVVLFLASEDAGYITGDTMVVAGGSYIRP
jgi:3-oxoacyl-[acyl-carrier protein] reductase